MNIQTSSILRANRDQQTPKGGQPDGQKTIQVMIVDDSLTVRTIFKRMVESDDQMAVCATASSGEKAISQLKTQSADVVLLDLEMPGMGGLGALPAILEAAPAAQVLVVSSLTSDGAEATIEALSTGAADTMLKPRPGGFNEEYRSQLLGKIRALGGQNEPPDSEPVAAAANGTPKAPAKRPKGKRPELVAIGASTGGIHALNLMLRTITPDFDLPILITQHLPSSFIPVFARQIETSSNRPTIIAEDGVEIRSGEIAIAAGHGHMVIRRIGDRLIAKTSCEPARSGCLPSVDPMLSSVSEACNGRALAIILSGMGRDGLHGARELVEAGGTVWAQNADTSAVWGMPGAVAKDGLTSFVAAPDALGAALMQSFAASAAPEDDADIGG